MPECFLCKAVFIFCNLAFQDGHYSALLKIAQNIKMIISNNRLTDFDQICVKMILALRFLSKLNKNIPVKMAVRGCH